MISAAGRAKIAILDDYQAAAMRVADWSRVASQSDISVFRTHLGSNEAIISALHDFDIICVMRERTPLTRSILSALPRLQLIASTARYNASIDMKAAEDLGIAVAWTDHLWYGTAELTWGLILSALRHIPAETASLRTGGWQTEIGRDIYGRTLGIVGLGNIGKTVAKVGAAFGMRVVAWSQNLDPLAAEFEGVRAVSKEVLFRESDVISLHMVLSERSRGLVGATELGQMKSSAWLVNTSRGALVDEAALVEALQSGKIAGAAVDTYEEEPLSANHPFRRLQNVIATPHIGFVTEDTYRIFYQQSVENILAWLSGVPIRTEMPSPQVRDNR
jgi:phosphoglycerate dehydrogenase-like enzyme